MITHALMLSNRAWLLGLLLVGACSSPSAEGLAEGGPGEGDYAGGQSGDEGTQLATPCLPSERTAFLGELTRLETGVATVTITEALTPAAEARLDSLNGQLEGCVSSFFTTELPSPGQEVLIIVFDQDEDETSPSIALAGMQDEKVMFTKNGPITALTVAELLGPNCPADWEEAQASATGSRDEAPTVSAPADCGDLD